MFSIVIQAGGESRRMGQDKALVPFLGRPLIMRLVERMRPAASDLHITTNHAAAFGALAPLCKPDLQPTRGALGGLYTALHTALSDIVGVVACDMPFANPELLLHLADILRTTHADIAIPRPNGQYEPFHAVYRKNTCLPAVRAALEQGETRIISFFSVVIVHPLDENALAPYNPTLTFFNVNTPQELRQAEVLARQIE